MNSGLNIRAYSGDDRDAAEGFQVVDVIPNGYGPGFDRVTMRLLL